MIPGAFAYVRADSVEEAVRLMRESGGEAKLLAGGHSLVPLMKFRLSSPATLIDISRIPQLRGVKREGNRLVVGALTTHRELSRDPLVSELIPVLAQAAAQIGDMQVRNRGTVGGNLAHADPAADLPGVALALDALLECQGADGRELLEADEFFIGPMITALPENSVLTSISFAIPPTGANSVYLKFPHPASGYAVIGVCAIAATDPDGTVSFVRIGINGAGDVAYRAKAVENSLLGQEPTVETIRRAASLAAEDGDIGSDLYASEEYRRHLCKVYTERALRQVLLGQ